MPLLQGNGSLKKIIVTRANGPKPARPSKKQTGASTGKTAGVEKTPGPAPVSTNQIKNPRCEALPINKAPKVRPKKTPCTQKNAPLARKR